MGHEQDKKKMFFHGISTKMLFDGFYQSFYGPTSTTTKYDVAVNFATNNGIVLKIKNNGFATTFFECISWSRFPWEYEMLFIGGMNKLEICGLIEMKDEINYDRYIRAIKIFQNGFIDGISSSDKILMSDKEIIYKLINLNNKQIPKYIIDLFQNLIKKTKCIHIDIGIFNKEIYFVYDDGDIRFGYLLLRDIYFDSNNNIKWNIISKLFTSLHTIYIKKVDKIENELNGYKYGESIFMTDLLLTDILSFLCSPNNKCKYIVILYPLNSRSSLQSLINKYLKKYNQNNYHLKIEQYNHPQFGSCISFCVLPS